MTKTINETQLRKIISESIKNILLTEADRHRPGYYAEYAKKTGKKDRHKPGYYKKYNQLHPERLERGYTKGYVDGKYSNGPEVKRGGIYFDSLGRPRSIDPFNNPTFTDAIDMHELMWHDDDWCEDVD